MHRHVCNTGLQNCSACICQRMHVCTYVPRYVVMYVCMYVCMYACMHACMMSACKHTAMTVLDV